MRKARTAAGVLGIAALAALTGAAHAPTASATEPITTATAAADGNFYVYNSQFRLDLCAIFDGNADTWGYCANKSESLWNNGYPGNFDDVLVFWSYNYQGAWRGLYNGALLDSLDDFTFDYSGGLPGHGEKLWHNIASHKWTNL
jgi:hypothetical protein